VTDESPPLCLVHVWAQGGDYHLTHPPTWLWVCTRCHSIGTGKEGEPVEWLRQLPADEFTALVTQPPFTRSRPSVSTSTISHSD